MGQRINIQYSIDINELSTEVARLLAGVFDSLGSMPNTLGEPHEILKLQTLDEIDSMRQQLSAVDHTLADVTSLVSAYIAFRAQEAAGSPTVEEGANEESTEN